MSGAALIFSPAIPWPMLAGFALLAGLVTGFAAWRGLAGWPWRALAAALLLAALAGPALQVEEREALPDLLLALVDESASQRLGERAAQTDAALAALESMVAARDGLELHIARAGDAPDNGGTRLMSALGAVLGDLPRDRVAGVVLISDGQVHDFAALPDLPAPMHLLLSGDGADWDRRLVVKQAPGFAIPGEEEVITLRVENSGAVPDDAGAAELRIGLDGEERIRQVVPVGVDIELPLVLSHGGETVVDATLVPVPGELTRRNNQAVMRISGVRDRLRVLLVTGTPHPGTRSWRNLLKSDASVDLVHFTILRPPEKQDGVPVQELSLIAFPAQELFLEKIDEFDLIIFDRYQLRGILPASYLAEVRDYVIRGGAVLVAAGPDFASASSLARSPLAEILPAMPTSRVIEEGFLPEVSPDGARHPVTAGLADVAPAGGWGRWFRQVELAAARGYVVLSGAEGAPLLSLDRVGQGRIALLASDHAWLWSRGFEGGGPQLELLRRLAHWMMKEPELEEEALSAHAEGLSLTITRRSMLDAPGPVTITGPDGEARQITLAETAPGRFETTLVMAKTGLYRLKQGELSALAMLGPPAPREYRSPIASADPLGAAISASGGGVHRLEAGQPGLRPVRAGRAATGRGWIGYTPREAWRTLDLSLIPLMPPWLALLLSAGIALWAWLREGRLLRAFGRLEPKRT